MSEETGKGKTGGSQQTDLPQTPEQILGPYPEQTPDRQPPEDLAGEIWGVDIDSYPERDKSEDPKWAVRTVGTWIGLALFSLTFILVLTALGAIYD